VLEAREEAWHHQPYAVDVTVARLSTVWLVPVEEAQPEVIQGTAQETSPPVSAEVIADSMAEAASDAEAELATPSTKGAPS
jgi:hypothetical protein